MNMDISRKEYKLLLNLIGMAEEVFATMEYAESKMLLGSNHDKGLKTNWMAVAGWRKQGLRSCFWGHFSSVRVAGLW